MILLVVTVASSAAQGHLAHGASGVPHGIPNFCANPTVRSVATGPWSNPAVWSPARVPGTNDIVAIQSGTAVVYDVVSNAAVNCVGVDGRLEFRTDADTRLTVGTLIVMPSGTLQVGTESAPVAAGALAEIVIANHPLNTSTDPDQFGTGIIGLGTVTIHGAARTPTFSRLTTEPRAGQSTLDLSDTPTGWRIGDKLFLPDTRQLIYGDNGPPQWEELTVSQIAGRRITLTQPLAFNHFGSRTDAGSVEFLPHVANLTRNVLIRSAAPNGTRGHAIFVARANVNIRYALFRDFGRTKNTPLDSTERDGSGNVTHVGSNQVGRYPIHLHHVMGPLSTPASGYQFTLVGNAVERSPKWAITLHSTHHGLVSGNVMYLNEGSALVTEDGSESFNVIERNFVARVFGPNARPDTRPGDLAFEGAGFWFRGPNNYVRDNVAANSSQMGYIYAAGSANFARVPRFKGADILKDGEVTVVDMEATPILENSRNEAYGATLKGMEIWNISTSADLPRESVFRGFRSWHHTEYGIWHYPSRRITIDGAVIRGDKNAMMSGLPSGIIFGDYEAHGDIVRNVDVQGQSIGIEAPLLADRLRASGANAGRIIIENSYFRNLVNINMMTLFLTGDPKELPPRRMYVINSRFDNVSGVQVAGMEPRAFRMQYLVQQTSNLIQFDALHVFGYNNVAGDDFRVYFREQGPNFVVPQTSSEAGVGSPEAGLTNAQNWSRYRIAIAGAVAPCSTTRPGIEGFVCAPTDAPPSSTPPTSAPPAPTNVRIITSGM